MWVPVEWGCGAGGADAAGVAPAPCARCKHAAAALGEHVYVLGGRGAGGSLPLKDVWRYSLVERRWQRLECRGEAPPALQQHSCTPHGAALYVFGGEAAANSDTPLWRLDTQTLMWRHISSPVQAVARRCGGVRPAAGAGGAGAAPRGRRGHSAHALNDCLLIYGGYMDLRGSSNELWAFHYESETWSLVRTATPGPARHRHAGCVRGARLYVHGGQCDLRDANDLWHYDTISRVWAVARLARGARTPGARSGHVAAAVGNYLYIFGGEADGQPTNEMWRFHFETEMWERIVQSAQWPSPRAHCCALLLRGASADPGDSGGEDDGEAERGERAPPSPRRAAPPASLLREISKLSSFHLRRANRCSYSALGGGGDSSESLPRDAPALPKSHSAYVLVRRRAAPEPAEPAEPAEPGPREADLPPRRLAREPISVPDFADMVLPTPVLSPAEATKLVYLDSDEEEELRREAGAALAARGGERGGCGGERALGFSNPHYLCGDVRALGQALTPDSGVGAELEMRELRPAQTAVAPAARPAPRTAARPAPAPRPALRLLLLGGKGVGHAAGLHSPLSMWTYRLQ